MLANEKLNDAVLESDDGKITVRPLIFRERLIIALSSNPAFFRDGDTTYNTKITIKQADAIIKQAEAIIKQLEAEK